jgi:hypothetical protein
MGRLERSGHNGKSTTPNRVAILIFQLKHEFFYAVIEIRHKSLL